ncbi:hypothetical protein ACVW19_006728 [Streptomyces sp. TE5632]
MRSVPLWSSATWSPSGGATHSAGFAPSSGSLRHGSLAAVASPSSPCCRSSPLGAAGPPLRAAAHPCPRRHRRDGRRRPPVPRRGQPPRRRRRRGTPGDVHAVAQFLLGITSTGTATSVTFPQDGSPPMPGGGVGRPGCSIWRASAASRHPGSPDRALLRPRPHRQRQRPAHPGRGERLPAGSGAAGGRTVGREDTHVAMVAALQAKGFLADEDQVIGYGRRLSHQVMRPAPGADAAGDIGGRPATRSGSRTGSSRTRS